MFKWIRRLFRRERDELAENHRPYRLADAKLLIEQSAPSQESEPQPQRELTGDVAYDLVMFAADGDLATVEKLLSEGADPNDRTPDSRPLMGPPPGGFLALHSAARMGFPEIVERLLQAGAEIDARDQIGNTALCEAAGAGHTNIVSMLIEAGARVDERGAYWCDGVIRVLTPGCTPLIVAAMSGHTEVIKLLLEKGANPNDASDVGPTALNEAARTTADGLALLLNAGGEVDKTDEDGTNPLMAAASMGNKAAVQLLLEAGADPNSQDEDGTTALMFAAEDGYVDILRLLLDSGAELEAANQNGETAIDLAARWPEAQSYLVDKRGTE